MLDVVDSVEDHHPRDRRHLVGDIALLTARGATEDPEREGSAGEAGVRTGGRRRLRHRCGMDVVHRGHQAPSAAAAAAIRSGLT